MTRARDAAKGWRWDLIGLGALTIAALALRASQIKQGIAGDEVFTYKDVVGHSLKTVLTTVHTGGENSPPLFFALAWASAKLGNASVWIRLPSIVLGTATVPLTFVLGRELVGRVAALIGAGVMALAPFAVFYGVEARPYATMTFFVALSTLALLRAIRTGSRRWWLGYALAVAAAAYSHYTAIFALGVQALWSLWVCRRRLREPLAAVALAVVLYIPWFPHVRGKALGVIGALYPLGFHRVVTDLLRPFPGHPSAPLRAIPTLAGLVAVAVCLLGGAIALLLRQRAAGVTWSRGSVLLILLTIATPIGLLLYSLTVTDLWLPRGLSASMPAAALVVGALLAAWPSWLPALASAVVAVTLLLGTLRSFDPAYARGPYRTIASYLDASAAPRDPIAIASLVGVLAVPEMLARPHKIVGSIPAMWHATAPGGEAFIVLDDAIARFYKIGAPVHRGFRLIAHRHYAGALATEVFVYRRSP